ncbi:hypothetical protein K458DRAFT_390514 [Lentithecium fluviatile CBS 122367]|uniref:2EXR domain-containing protein n=1 Tax=Lentithecium fluviatile CBS 122367 TaxID=1168545 RepID=A0A6G1IWF2_9PLEO|nr:hypothetical protein K458DRAFT_390514 [Lentithecium fluviatile CBS 122367]
MIFTEQDPKLLEITRRNAETSPLLQLPAELRNRIWKFLFPPMIHDIALQHSVMQSGRYRHKALKRTPNMHAILMVCRQIQAEAAFLPFQLSTFSFLDLVLFKWLITLVSAERDLIPEVRFIVGSDRYLNAEFGWDNLLVSKYARLRLPGLKRVVVNVQHRHSPGANWDFEHVTRTVKGWNE